MVPSVDLKGPNGRPAGATTRMGERFDAPSRMGPWLARLVMTLAAWLVAFLIATGLLTFFGDELGSLPLALRALVISGVLVGLMANLVMPVLSTAIARWLAASPVRSTGMRGDPHAQAQGLAVRDA